KRVAAGARARMLAVIERRSEFGAFGGRAVGDERPPWLGRVVAGAADLRLAQPEVIGVAARARGVAGDDDLLADDRVAARARRLAHDVGVVAGVREPRIRTLHLKLRRWRRVT